MNIAIIGCGYIGSEIAALWSKKGHHVTATTRSPERLPELTKVAQKALVLKGNDEEELVPLLAGNDIILVTVAADNPEVYESAYLHTAQLFRHLALEMDLPLHLIYTSSTSVYGDHHGLWVDETSDLHAKAEQARLLTEAEKMYLSLQDLGWHVCILRLAEIYGPGRELSKRVHQLEGHTLPGTGEHYTNMIHKNDCISAIDYALRHHLEGIFNVADDDHPTRKELYDLISHKFRLPKVKWDPSLTSLHSGNKRISNHKIKSEGFSFRHHSRILD
ncbi:MAG TPA: SDR family oxidoreductase [Chlamydiales bacterium]|nr:SDR family oxidoreductase [Chlamydiales bacterium]